ncbi:uncharacterized protein PHACADRAFT_250791, partial [Phanerochaete carnosa HHB-10118-sp]
TSIPEVLFDALPPKQTSYLEMTTRARRRTYDAVIPLEFWNCPGTSTLEAPEASLGQFTTLVFVIDIQYDIDASQNFRLILQRVTADELIDMSPEYEQVPVESYLRSIYDYSLHEAFSRVPHKLMPSLLYLEDLLNVFCPCNLQASKAFLVDTLSPLYVATDASPVNPPTHSLCNDYLQMLNSFGPLYCSISASVPRCQQVSTSVITSPAPPQSASSPNARHAHTPLPPLSEDLPTLNSGLSSADVSAMASPKSGTPAPSTVAKTKSLFYPSASASLSPNAAGADTTVTYHLMTAHLTLLPTAIFETRRGLVEYNVVFFREGVREICGVEEEARKVG